MTQREIAVKLGISRSYVSRIEKAALEKLRDGFGIRE
jgi:RNA polymerase sporulation-specific sigma factor